MRLSSNLISVNKSLHAEFYSGELLHALWGKGVLYTKRCPLKELGPFLTTDHTNKWILCHNWHCRLFLRILGKSENSRKRPSMHRKTEVKVPFKWFCMMKKVLLCCHHGDFTRSESLSDGKFSREFFIKKPF